MHFLMPAAGKEFFLKKQPSPFTPNLVSESHTTPYIDRIYAYTHVY